MKFNLVNTTKALFLFHYLKAKRRLRKKGNVIETMGGLCHWSGAAQNSP